MRAARGVAGAVPALGPAERQVLQLVEPHAGELDVDRPSERSGAEAEHHRDERQVDQHREPESDAPLPRHATPLYGAVQSTRIPRH
jgi:hypothetical protein